MFGFLKKKLSESVERLSDKIKKKEEPERPGIEKKEGVKPAGKPKKAEKPRIEKKAVKKAKTEKPVEKKAVKVEKEEGTVREKPVKEEKFQEKPEERVEKPGGKAPEKAEAAKEERKGILSRFRREKKIPEESPKAGVKPEGIPEEREAGLKERISGRVLERKITEKDIDSLFEDMELGLMEANVALETMDFLRSRMKEHLVGRQLKRGRIEREVRDTLEKILLEIFDLKPMDIENLAGKKKPICIVFLGFNGSGKTTSIAKLGSYLLKRKFSAVLAAGDTWRSAAIEQLEVHGGKLGLKVIRHDYGSDSAAVIFDAVRHAESRGIDFVLADTAGRSHANRNLMDELKKVVRVNRPDIKILVMESLTGSDLVEQAKKFDEAVGVDAMIFTKMDVNEKGGGMLSACHAVKKPILYIGLGQKYEDIEIFDAKKFVRDLMGG